MSGSETRIKKILDCLPDGFDLKNTPTMGIQLVRILSEQLGSELKYSSEDGASFQIEFGEYHEAGTVVHGTMDSVN
jgi:hypothetical protein